MPRFHNTQDGPVQFTQEEEDARDAEEAAELAARPMNIWLHDIAKSDAQMTRIEEDIIEALDAATQQRLNQEVMDKYNNKKAVRARKP